MYRNVKSSLWLTSISPVIYGKLKQFFIRNLFLFLLSTPALFSQQPKIIFEHNTTRDGVSAPVVKCILQDRKGYMWFGTYSGLDRYDGIKFKSFKNIPGDTSTIVRGYVSCLLEDKKGNIWMGFSLEQNFPNPFNPSTKLKYSIPERSNILIGIYDVSGKEAAILINEEKPAGNYEVTWNADNVPSGIYFYQLKSGEFIQTKKMILMK